MTLKAVLAGLLLALTLGGAAFAQPAQRPAPLPRISYGDPANWLCLPGRANACNVDQSAMVVSAGGGLTLDEFTQPTREPPVDCFYVYPTASLDPGTFSDLIPGTEERQIIQTQFARFATACRQYAPLYRQVTRAGLGPILTQGGGRIPADSPLTTALPAGQGGAYNDVLEAWRWYMANENRGRGVILIGHSQGSFHLIQLIKNEIEGKPVQSQLVSAILLGATVQVAPGRDVGGTFNTIPLCKAPNQVGCVITYSSYRDTIPPPPNAIFGRREGLTVAACTNPADLRTGTGQPEGYLPAVRPNDPTTGQMQGWVTPWEPIGTPFVKAPGFLTTTCVTHGDFTYLEVHVNANPRDKRTDTLSGDLMRGAAVNASWGLHLIDMDMSIGDLVEIAGRQGRAWRPVRR